MYKYLDKITRKKFFVDETMVLVIKLIKMDLKKNN
jgi:hypothetical protein